MVQALLIGEIHTALLQNSVALPTRTVADLFSPVSNYGVRAWERPIRQAASAASLTGVDCTLPTSSGNRVRCVGTVIGDVWLTAGHLLQASAYATIFPSEHGRRLPWSHYLSHPGVVEAMGVVTASDLTSEPKAAASTLDLQSIARRAMDTVQRSELLDRRPPLRGARTRLWWSALEADDQPSVRFDVTGRSLRTIRLEAPVASAAGLPELCRDIAHHDWLLSALIHVIDAADIGRDAKAEVVSRLRPAVDHLIHVWMPTARLSDDLRDFWYEVDRRSGFSRQWESAVNRIRDQIALAAAENLARLGQIVQLPADSPAHL